MFIHALRVLPTRASRLASSLAAMCLIAGCTSAPSAPSTVDGVYVLRSIDGLAPGAEGNGPWMSPFLMLADTLRIVDGGQGWETLVSQSADRGVTRQVQPFTVTPSRGFDTPVGSLPLVTLSYPCPPNASCIAPPHHRGRLSGRRLIIEWSALYRTPLVFERVGPLP